VKVKKPTLDRYRLSPDFGGQAERRALNRDRTDAESASLRTLGFDLIECGTYGKAEGQVSERRSAFNPKGFLITIGRGRKLVPFRKGQTIYSQGDAADALFVIQNGTVKLSVESEGEREAILDILSDGDFVGEDAMTGQASRSALASAMTNCSLLRVEKNAMLHALTRQLKLANMFWVYVLTKNIRYQQDLVDQHCKLSEKRLKRVLLRLAHYGGRRAPEATIPKMSHETLAQMVGTTRSRISFFMTRFKGSGLVSYERKGKLLRVNRKLLTFSSR
jgi:CRP/FNR family cyclic AMP-dependent transcriptional regulator